MLIEKRNRYYKFFFSVLLISLLLFSLLYIQFGNDFSFYPKIKQHETCLEKLSEGNLYQEEAQCYQGPFLYLTTYFLKTISPIDFDTMIIILSIILYILLFHIVYNIVGKEACKNKINYCLTIFLFILLIFLFPLNTFDFETLYSLLLFLSGFYLIFYSSFRLKEVFVGILFALTFLTKQTYFYLLICAYLFFIIKTLNIKIFPFNFNSKKLTSIILSILSFSSILLLFHFLFPNFLRYTFSLSQSFSEDSGLSVSIFSGGFSDFFENFIFIIKLQTDLVLLLLTLVVLTSLFLFFYNRSFIVNYTLTVSLFMAVFNLFSLGDNLIQYNVLLPILPFFIVLILKIKNYTKDNLAGKFILVLLFILLAYPGIKIVSLNYQVMQLEREVGEPIRFVPENNFILTERDRFQYYEDFNRKIEIIKDRPFGRYDVYGGSRLEKSGLINLQEFRSDELKKMVSFYSPIIQNIIQKKYNAIIYKPASDGLIINRLIGIIREISITQGIPFDQLFSMQCYVYMATLEDRCSDCHFTLVQYFDDNSNCISMKEKLTDYYTEHFDSICKKDRLTADYLKSTLLQNGINFDKDCEHGGDLLEKYFTRRDLKKNDFFMVISIFAVFIVFSLYNKERREIFYKNLKNGYINNKKFIFIVFILSLFALILFFYDSNTCGKFNILHEDRCCSDINNDEICDVVYSLNECLIGESQNKIAFGKLCNNVNDCLEYAKQIQIPRDYLKIEYFECRETTYIDMPEFIPCFTKQNCLDSIDNSTDLNDVIRCGGSGFCEMTSFSSISLMNTYTYKGGNFLK